MAIATPKNLGFLFLETARNYPDKPAFLRKIDGRYVPLVWKDAVRQIASLAAVLSEKGLVAGDRLAILSENRFEWAFTDLAAQCLGVATVPIYATLTAGEVRYILEDSAARAIAVSTKAQLEKFTRACEGGRSPAAGCVAALVFDPEVQALQADCPVPIVPVGQALRREGDPERLERLAAAVPPDAIASLIYTSGTTGPPKGVELTHSNFIQNVVAARETLKMGPADVHLSFLPLCHVFERMAGHYLMVHIGATIAYAENLDTVPKNLLEVRPTFILGVPRFFEKIRDRVLEAVRSAGPFRKGIFFWAKELGEKRRLGGKTGALQRALADRLVYSKFRARLGGRVRFCVSGGAALAKELAEFFADLGVMVYEGYGLTETSPVISVNREGRWKFGSVGVPLETVSVRIAEDGEILTAGPCVMKGYHNKPAETAEVLRDGWFHTGDLGTIDREGFLTITGRKKELIVTSGGKKISTRAVEELVEADPHVLRCVLFGEGRKFITALIVPDRQKLLEHAASEKIAFTSYADLLRNAKVRDFLAARIEALSQDLANYERIKYFHLAERDFSQEAGELTPTLKVKRDVVLRRYKEDLLRLYEGV